MFTYSNGKYYLVAVKLNDQNKVSLVLKNKIYGFMVEVFTICEEAQGLIPGLSTLPGQAC